MKSRELPDTQLLWKGNPPLKTEKGLRDDHPGASATAGEKNSSEAQTANSAARPAPEPSPRGLDSQRHAAGQAAAQRAEILYRSHLPAWMATALRFPQSDSEVFDPNSIRIYLDRLLAEEGNPKSPGHRMLIEQMGILHLHLTELLSKTISAKSIEATKRWNGLYLNGLTEMRKIVTTLSLLDQQGRSAPKMRMHQSG